MSGGDRSSTQGSNVSKPGGCGEDGEGGCNRSASGVLEFGFCSKSSTRIP